MFKKPHRQSIINIAESSIIIQQKNSSRNVLLHRSKLLIIVAFNLKIQEVNLVTNSLLGHCFGLILVPSNPLY